ncbi:hypothetical protein PG993_011388 [Apiospora rasikravindrae]|uniref:RING-type domain-containing protein n=1 Tax=Apiospora rasikravindrae TaxID=990691 RepID=A0ABR1SE37_9PEZI
MHLSHTPSTDPSVVTPVEAMPSNKPEGKAESTVIESQYILDFARHIGKAGQPGEPTLHSECVVCRQTLDISTCVSDMIKEEHALAGTQLGAKTWREFYEKHELERTVVLKCGHLIGRDCFKAIQVDYDDPKKPNAINPGICFHCRADIGCDGCGYPLFDATFSPFIPGSQSPGNDPATSRWCPDYSFQNLTLTAAEKDRHVKRYCDTCTRFQIMRKFLECTLACPQCPTCASSPCSCGPEQKKKETKEKKQQHSPHLDREALAEEWLRRKVTQLSRLVYPSVADTRSPHLAAQRGRQIFDKRAHFVKAMLAHPKLCELKQVVFRLQEDEEEHSTVRGKLKTLVRSISFPFPKGSKATGPNPQLEQKQQQQQQQQTVVPEPYWAHWAFCLAVQCVEEFQRTNRTLRLPLAWYRGLEGDDDDGFHILGTRESSRRGLPKRWSKATGAFVLTMGGASPAEGFARVNPRLFAGTQEELVEVMWTYDGLYTLGPLGGL